MISGMEVHKYKGVEARFADLSLYLRYPMIFNSGEG